MKSERVLYANDEAIAREGIQHAMKKIESESDHKLIAMVSSVDELEKYLRSNKERPTVFLFDPRFPTSDDGEDAVKLVHELSPETKIVTLPSYDWARFVDEKHKLRAGITVEALKDYLTDLKS